MSTVPGALQFMVVIFGFMLQVSWCRYMSMSLNFSMAMSDERHSPISLEVIHQCMRSTELSMADLQRFRQSLSTNEQNDEDDTVWDEGADQINAEEDTANESDQESSTLYGGGEVVQSEEITKLLDDETLTETDHRDQSLHCFTHCLYEKLGVIKNDFVVEEVVYRKLLAMLAHEDSGVPECNRLGSANKCEATYKLHLCYNRLKFMEAERRIRRILESKDFYGNEDDATDKDAGDDATKAVQDGDADIYYDDDNGDATTDADFSTNEIETS